MRKQRVGRNWLTLALVKDAPEVGIMEIGVEGAEKVGVEEDFAAF